MSDKFRCWASAHIAIFIVMIGLDQEHVNLAS